MAIHQEVTIKGTPDAVFGILTSSEKFTAMTGGRKAEISTEEGGTASMFGGDIQARNIELKPGKRVVQAWRADGWPDGIYSLVKFELEADGGNTKVVFDQIGHPADATEMLEGGWHQMYWQPMNALLG
jgi:uncharacterized protein YndB with AHSA1/START domain